MRVRFIGDPRDNFSGPDVLEMFSMKFPRDQWVNVEEGPFAVKLRRHSHFEVDDDMIASDGSAIEPVKPTRLRDIPDARRDELVDEAESLGVKVDGRWSLARLEDEIAAAKTKAN